MEEGYTTRELDHYFKDFKDELLEIKADGKETKTQVKLTNGRVSKLENWRWMLTGGMVVISMLVIPLVIYIFNLK